MKQPRLRAPTRVFTTVLALALLAAGAAGFDARADDSQGASSHNMKLVGTNDLAWRLATLPGRRRARVSTPDGSHRRNSRRSCRSNLTRQQHRRADARHHKSSG